MSDRPAGTEKPLTVMEVAKLLGESRQSINERVRAGELEVAQEGTGGKGNGKTISEESFERLRARLEKEAAERLRRLRAAKRGKGKG